MGDVNFGYDSSKQLKDLLPATSEYTGTDWNEFFNWVHKNNKGSIVFEIFQK